VARSTIGTVRYRGNIVKHSDSSKPGKDASA